MEPEERNEENLANEEANQPQQDQQADNANMASSQNVSQAARDSNVGMRQSNVTAKKQSNEELWKPYDFLFPGGKLAKLIKISNAYKKNMPIGDMLAKFKYTDAFPVVNIIGGMENNRGKFYAGIARAAFNTDAVIITNGIATGIQKFVLRRGVKMIGVAPEKQIKFPKINPTFVEKMELANGHSHLFLLNNPDKDLPWGGEVSFKINLALKVAQGKKKGQPNCKIVSILIGDAPFEVNDEVKEAVDNQIPIIIVPGSPLCDELIKNSTSEEQPSYSNEEMKELIDRGHFFFCNSTNSQDIAQLVHLLLTIRPW